jgi:uncharacterized protein YqhQ
MLNETSVMRSSRLHPRCGTSFLLYVMIISCIMFFFINVSDPILRLIIRLVLVPVIAGIAYELIRLAGRFDNYFTRVMSVPGMLVQKITTKEPTPEMIEVAIKAVEAVFDWEEFQKRAFGYDDSEEYIFEEDAAEYDEDVLEETFHQIPKEELEESSAEEAIVQEQKDDI